MARARENDKDARRARQRTQQQQVEQSRIVSRQRQRRTRIGMGIAGILVVAIAAFFALRGSSSGGGAGTAVAAGLGSPTSALPSSPTGQFQPAGPILHQGGKVELLFIGAQYCPFCAAERWSIVKALDQFGRFSRLQSTTNAQGEGGFGLLPTFELMGAGYGSQFVSLDHKDLEDRNHRSLQSLTSTEQTLFNKYDPSGGIPLVAVGGYSQSGSGYDPGNIDGKSFAQVQQALQQNSPVAFVDHINAEANVLTALICHADGNRPSAACGRSAIRQIEHNLR